KVLELARLRVEPFDVGSFVIPGILAEDPIVIPVNGQTNAFTGHGVLERFVEIMNGAASRGGPSQTSVGALQAIEELGKILRREAVLIEYRPMGFSQEPTEPTSILVDRQYVDAVSANRKFRVDPRSAPDQLNGVLTAVDLAESKFKM